MPNTIKLPHPDTLLAERDGAKLYALQPNEEFPLYRRVKLILPATAPRRVYYLAFIIHQGRLKRGGDCWRLLQSYPDTHAWALGECAQAFTPEAARSDFGLTPEEWAARVAAEEAKYKKA